MEPAPQQQARELAQLHRTIATMANVLEMQNTLEEALWRWMKTGLEEKEKLRDTYHPDDVQ
jgi:hypothetical protein